MSRPVVSGFVVLQGNRLEMLRDVVFDWLARHPLAPLEEEVFVAQSNRAAEWLKIGLATSRGVCAATRVELPARFVWQLYRCVLGRERVPACSSLDRDALVWRLMRLLPMLTTASATRADFAPIARFLRGADSERRLQLARRVAALYDQYQVYRADWLAAWEAGDARMPDTDGPGPLLPDDERWQAVLWRALLDELAPAARAATRAHVHRAFLEHLAAGADPALTLPPRAVLFGASHLPAQWLDAFAAVSSRMQILLAVPNPCRFHWADVIDGREALRQPHGRLPDKDGPLAAVALDAMHLHANPLLAAWGRQGRDFMRALDAFDDRAASARLDLPQIDCFDAGDGATLLEQVQARIRDLVPVGELPRTVVASTDRSIVFHVAHGMQREVEILHDRLLAMFAADPSLRPRDVVVMVPDIDAFAPSVRAVFGQHGRGDARFVPFDIADLRTRGVDPLVGGVEWLLHLPERRVTLGEVRDFLEIPAVAARFDLDGAALPRLFAWLQGAGVRWGLDATHRERLGFAAAGEQNTWLFGVRRMLLGYATGNAPGFAGVEPFDEVGGLDAAHVGALVALLDAVDAWSATAATPATPLGWAERGRALLAAFFAPTDERERLAVAALQGALGDWLEASVDASFDEAVPATILREAWLPALDAPDAERRFTTGGVTFCTLTPLRSVPFAVVCLLGMNDGAFPRASRNADFDLMALPGRSRPGDRSRRDDDRYLMLEAVLSARRTLYLGWTGRNPRDNTPQPPSVLVAQLRDYLAADWCDVGGGDVLAGRTTEHPLQPFSTRYFEADGLATYAREWRAAHRAPPRAVARRPAPTVVGTPAGRVLSLGQLAQVLRNPVRVLFRDRFLVDARDGPDPLEDDEPFVLAGLDAYSLKQVLLVDDDEIDRWGVDEAIARRLRRAVGTGSLPLREVGARVADAAVAVVAPMTARWRAVRAEVPLVVPRRAVRYAFGSGAAAATLDDWIGDLRAGPAHPSSIVRVVRTPSALCAKKDRRADRFVVAWVAMLAGAATGSAFATIVVGCDYTATLAPLDRADAATRLDGLAALWRAAQLEPLPFAPRTALAFVAKGGRDARTIYEGSGEVEGERTRDAGLRRQFPTFETLAADGRFAHFADEFFAPLARWVADGAFVAHGESPSGDGGRARVARAR